MIHFAVFLCAAVGFAALCASRGRHQRDLFGRQFSPTRSYQLRIAGWIMLVLALVLAIAGLGAALGLIAWVGCLSVGALMSVVWLNRASTR